MKSFIFTLIIVFAGTAAVNAQPAASYAATADNHSMEWRIDQAHSSILFKINHFFNPVPGTFSEFDGLVNFNPDTPEHGEIDVTVKVASIDTRVERRDGHLLSEDFFEAETYPDMHFRSTDIRHVEGDKYTALGQLTIKDVTREIELPFEFLGVTDHLMQDDVLVAGLHGTLELKRNDFGVGVGDWASTAVVGDDVSIEILLQVHKDK